MRKLVMFLAVVVVGGASWGATACTNPESREGERTRREQVEQVGEMMAESQNQVGMPEITQFNERQIMKRIMELRDREIATFTYTYDERGRLHHLCASIGYGLPYSTQMTNPNKIARSSHNYGYAILPQAEPNGLFMPQNVDATWILCQMEESDETTPVYSEPDIIVSPEPLDALDTHQPGGE